VMRRARGLIGGSYSKKRVTPSSYRQDFGIPILVRR
jgi:hypothetical protein